MFFWRGAAFSEVVCQFHSAEAALIYLWRLLLTVLAFPLTGDRP